MVLVTCHSSRRPSMTAFFTTSQHKHPIMTIKKKKIIPIIRNNNNPNHKPFMIPSFHNYNHHDYDNSLLYSKASQKEEEEKVSFDLFIEYCTGCRWLLRSLWMTQELFTTFQKNEITSITLIPNQPIPSMKGGGGVFQIQYKMKKNEEKEEEKENKFFLLWDRKSMGGFPELKQIKQMIRNIIAPEKSLGHSDSTPIILIHNNNNSSNNNNSTSSTILGMNNMTKVQDCIECNPISSSSSSSSSFSSIKMNDTMTITSSITSTITTTTTTNNLAIYYSNPTLMYRCTWLAQEILSPYSILHQEEDKEKETFKKNKIHSITLIPLVEKNKKDEEEEEEDDEIIIKYNNVIVLQWKKKQNKNNNNISFFYELEELFDTLTFIQRNNDIKQEEEEMDEMMEKEELEQMKRFFGVA